MCDLDDQHPGSCQSVTECLRVHVCMLVFVQGIFPSAILIAFALVISISNHKVPRTDTLFAVLKTLGGKKSFSIKMIKQTSVTNFLTLVNYFQCMESMSSCYPFQLTFTLNA